MKLNVRTELIGLTIFILGVWALSVDWRIFSGVILLIWSNDLGSRK